MSLRFGCYFRLFLLFLLPCLFFRFFLGFFFYRLCWFDSTELTICVTPFRLAMILSCLLFRLFLLDRLLFALLLNFLLFNLLFRLLFNLLLFRGLFLFHLLYILLTFNILCFSLLLFVSSFFSLLLHRYLFLTDRALSLLSIYRLSGTRYFLWRLRAFPSRSRLCCCCCCCVLIAPISVPALCLKWLVNIVHLNTLADQEIGSQPGNSVLRLHFILLMSMTSTEQKHLGGERNQSRETHIRKIVRIQHNIAAGHELLQERNLRNRGRDEIIGSDTVQLVNLEKTLIIQLLANRSRWAQFRS